MYALLSVPARVTPTLLVPEGGVTTWLAEVQELLAATLKDTQSALTRVVQAKSEA
jgi:hypothetical protein